MATKRPKHPADAPPPDDEVAASSTFMVERAIASLHRALSGREFGATGEADAFINRILDDGTAEELSAPRSRLDQAQDLMYDAWDAVDDVERVTLAETALEISPDCADAYTLLGNEKAYSLAEARMYYEEGVRAGRRALGEKFFEDNVGHFWGILETRPFMRASVQLALVNWEMGDRAAAIDRMQDMLRLNPGDNQGIRYLLLKILVEEKDDAAVERLFNAYPDESATSWLYDRALWLIQKHTPASEIDAALDDAIAANEFVPQLMLGRKRLPRDVPDFYSMGDESEAVIYAKDGKRRWVRMIGALEFLRRAIARKKKRSRKV
jgi:tetratricopeptide (TPR) repeat protein